MVFFLTIIKKTKFLIKEFTKILPCPICLLFRAVSHQFCSESDKKILFYILLCFVHLVSKFQLTISNTIKIVPFQRFFYQFWQKIGTKKCHTIFDCDLLLSPYIIFLKIWVSYFFFKNINILFKIMDIFKSNL